MLQYAIAVFLALHGLVHGWYVVLSQGWVEYEAEMGWNGYSWLLSGVLGQESTLAVASVLYVLVALGFVASGVGYLTEQDWWVSALVVAAVLSSVVIVALWDGRPEQLVEKGVVGVLINVGLLAWVLYFR